MPYLLEDAYTCEEHLTHTTLLKENANFLCNVMIYSGFITICTSAAVFASNVKVFQSEHRNRK